RAPHPLAAIALHRTFARERIRRGLGSAGQPRRRAGRGGAPQRWPARSPGSPGMITIIGRQSSHYTRQVRLLAHELGVDYRLEPVHDLLGEDPAAYGGNPALKLPALCTGDAVV